MTRDEKAVRRRALWLLLIMALLAGEKSWGEELNRAEIVEMIGSESIYEGEEVAQIVTEILRICDEENLILLEEQRIQYEGTLNQISEDLRMEQLRMKRWKTLLWVETGIIAGALLYRWEDNR